MADQGPRLVHIVDDVPELDGTDELTMVVALSGFLDAGQASALAVQHLQSLGDGPVVATFDIDALYDYRARRPPVTFVQDHYEGYEAPRLNVRLLRDTGGTPFLLLRGPEPDIRWEGFALAVREVVERLGVTRVVSLGAIPMAVPHTRPVAVTYHSNDPALLTGRSAWSGEVRVPSSVQALLEIRLGEWGHAALGYITHIPHYLAQMEYPVASLVLLEQLERGGRLTVDLTALRRSAEECEEEIVDYLADHSEVADVVHALEQQYDAFRRSEEAGASLLAPDEPLPTGEDLGAQFEQFLAGLDRPDADGEQE
ncbi:proteasome assembly chaperone family protein [Nocardioides daphniae]|uniref:proteasome assembly chaperone family protein n=1 Tax=Nocardioides daphniae TaxID=402297 RepID=UPI00166AC9F6|nr:PAC2 family protein [Nocardioides daphniae]